MLLHGCHAVACMLPTSAASASKPRPLGAAHLRAVTWVEGTAMTRRLQAACSRRSTLTVLASTTICVREPRPGRGGRSSSSSSTAARSDCASASSGHLRPRARGPPPQRRQLIMSFMGSVRLVRAPARARAGPRLNAATSSCKLWEVFFS